MIQVKPPLKIRVLSYDKITLDGLDHNEWLFAINNGVIDESGDLYLTHWIGEASWGYKRRYLR